MDGNQYETYRHQCEVRWCLKMRKEFGKSWLIKYLNSITNKQRQDKLRIDIWNQWTLGNRGEDKTWL